MQRKTLILTLVGLVVLAGLTFILFPIVQREIKLTGIKNKIEQQEKQKSQLQLETNNLSKERQKCEILQQEASEQAKNHRAEIIVIDSEINKLKSEYNSIFGFILAGQ